jgi:hypothetical protein
MIDTDKDITAEQHAFLPAELFPMIADSLFDARAKKTLVRLLCANRQMHLLCLPSLMRSVHLSERNRFTNARPLEFSRDGLGTGKFGLVKALYASMGSYWDENMGSWKRSLGTQSIWRRWDGSNPVDETWWCRRVFGRTASKIRRCLSKACTSALRHSTSLARPLH